jgi:hypothetical protein
MEQRPKVVLVTPRGGSGLGSRRAGKKKGPAILRGPNIYSRREHPKRARDPRLVGTQFWLQKSHVAAEKLTRLHRDPA